ncbi:MAG TPA: polyprenyl synthetase family protein, partial [Candidatus Thermoplasmatota archaeon]|nr:polyprenyl synthetase family protein [Candidatus Thermoplasmatota archaeon]
MEGLQEALASRRRAVDAALAGAFAIIAPDALREAARWYHDAGGKRLRPVMALLSCEAAGGAPEAALPVAVSVELVHNFS